METQKPTEPTKPDAQNPAINPMLESAGKFADDPFWDEMLDSIRRHRLEMDAEWDNAE
jgi:hypothetical protein